ncbi:plasmid mobilization relaxosome protein MobC [Kutzneria sp. CA-103260]|uniref:plasmid mobilization relaxosome protein MobC n=1 Tax=Kutzneria sp. CA-103260 TaxID=2802641 RepID=UPI001BACB62F|nr:plasmid mobilization relaxosome protein MobC [Kutzneria sp. CA-103260]QUQ72535.1 Bacterial mobilization protein (MobC) [Kutzneria sp. CA-103260]
MLPNGSWHHDLAAALAHPGGIDPTPPASTTQGVGVARKTSRAGYREHSIYKRLLSKTARFNVVELEAVAIAAASDCKTIGAWIAQAAVDAAQRRINAPRVEAGELGRALQQLRAELAEDRRVSKLHGNNLNQIAHRANIDGEVVDDLGAVLERIERVISSQESRLRKVDQLLAAIIARVERTR